MKRYNQKELEKFDIKVLGIQDGSVEAPELIKAVNDAPQQYPIYEEDEGWG